MKAVWFDVQRVLVAHRVSAESIRLFSQNRCGFPIESQRILISAKQGNLGRTPTMRKPSRWIKSGRVRLPVAALCIICAISGCRTSPSPTLTLSVAASLQDAIVEVEASYTRESALAIDFRNNFGSSGTLAREIENGAPVDVIVAAGERPVDDLQAKGMLAPGTRRN